MDYELDPKLTLILFIIFISTLILLLNIIVNYSPPDNTPPIPKYDYNLTIHTGTIKHYTLRIESAYDINSYTITQSNYTINLKEGQYQIEACYYSNNYPQCESHSINLIKNTNTTFFGGK